MNTLLRKLADGTVHRYIGEEAANIMNKMRLDHMVLDMMFGGIPLTIDDAMSRKLGVPVGAYVIEQEGHEFMVADFKNQS